MLYPITVSATPDDNQALNSSSLYAIPFTLEEGGSLRCIIVHTAPTQDHSLRCWISTTAGDTQVDAASHLSYWHPNRTNAESVIIHDTDVEVFLGSSFARPLPPGEYFVNILNLGNSINSFSFLLTEIQ